MRGLFVVLVLIASLVSQGTAQLPFGPEFNLSQYQTTEGETLVVHLSAPILTRPQVPPFSGSIEVDITAEDLPWQNAEFGSDYLVNIQNPSSRTFTVTFLSKQANSTEHEIVFADDSILEGTEAFHLRIVAARFIGQAAALFTAPAELNSTSADVFIEDNDFVEVSWIISEPIEVREGEGVRLELFAQAYGLYATSIEIGVVCAQPIVGVPSAFPDRDFVVLSGSTLEFTDVETLRSNSSNKVVLSIINDDIAEPCESFICTLQGRAVDQVRGVEPNRVTVYICDDDEVLVHWARDVYEFTESQITGTVELVTDSTLEVFLISILGFSRQIPSGDPNRFPSLVVPGPSFPGTQFATIERVFIRVPALLFGNRIFGNAQVTQSGRSDAVNTINDFVFTPNSTSAFENFTIVDDDVLEFDEIFIAEFSFDPVIANYWNARKVQPMTAFILIRDDDSVEVNFNENGYTVAESDGQVSVSLRIDGQFFIPVWAIVEISDGTATDPEDYSSAMRYNVTFRQTVSTDGDEPENTALSSPILINITNDDILEDGEYFQARIVETSDEVRVRIGQDTVNVTIIDTVEVNFNENGYTVVESDGQVSVSLRIDGQFYVPMWAVVEISEGTATDPEDYSNTGRYNVTFRQTVSTDGDQPENTALSSPIVIDITNDDIIEGVEFFQAHILETSDEVRVRIGQGTVNITIIDNDVSIFHDKTAYRTFENKIRVLVMLRLNDTYHEDIVVNVTVGELEGTEDVLKAEAGVDFSTDGFPKQVTIPAGQTSVQFEVRVINDLIVERDEQFQVSFTYSGGQPGVVVRPGFDEANITIENDDALRVKFERNLYPVREDVGNLSYRLIAVSSKTASFSYEVMVTAVDGTAKCGLDYDTPVAMTSADVGPVSKCSYSLNVAIPAGEVAGSGVVAIIDDTLYDGRKEFHFHLSVSPEFQKRRILVENPRRMRVTVQIEDDDELSVFFKTSFYSVPEGDILPIVLQTNKHFDVPFTIDVTIVEGTAVAPGDYEDRSYQVEFNVTTQTGTLVVHTETDNIIENDEDFTAVLSVPAGLPRVFEETPSEATVTILDQTTAEVYFDPATYNVTEGQPADLILRLTSDVDPSVTIIMVVQIMQGSRDSGPDYTSGLLTAAFRGSSTAVVPVPTLPNNNVEGEENFTAVILVPLDATLACRVTRGTPATATVVINDDYDPQSADPLCTFQHCTTDRAALCTVVRANGNCTNQATSCTACYFAREERPLPDKCSTDLRNYSCAGLTGSDLKECLQTWGECVKKAFKDVHGKTPRRLRKKRFFKCPEFPCN